MEFVEEFIGDEKVAQGWRFEENVTGLKCPFPIV